MVVGSALFSHEHRVFLCRALSVSFFLLPFFCLRVFLLCPFPCLTGLFISVWTLVLFFTMAGTTREAIPSWGMHWCGRGVLVCGSFYRFFLSLRQCGRAFWPCIVFWFAGKASSDAFPDVIG